MAATDTYRILTPEPDSNEFTVEYEGLTKWQLKRALKAMKGYWSLAFIRVEAETHNRPAMRHEREKIAVWAEINRRLDERLESKPAQARLFA